MRLPRLGRSTQFAIGAGVIAGGLVHIVMILAWPAVSSVGAVERIENATKLHELVVLPPIGPDTQPFPFMAPDVRYALCRYDLAQGPLSIRAELVDPTWSVALYDSRGSNFFTLTAADLQRRELELILAPTDDVGTVSLPLGRDKPASAVTVAVGDKIGLVVLRAPVLGLSYEAEIDRALAEASCSLKSRADTVPAL